MHRHLHARGDPNGEVWTPRFTFHGFRYVEATIMERYRENLEPFTRETVTGLALSSASTRPGRSSAATPVNQLQSNIQWGQPATSWRCRPTARSATSVSAGRATRRCSHPRRRSTWMSPPSSPSGRATATTPKWPTARCRCSCRTCSAGRRRPGLVRRPRVVRLVHLPRLRRRARTRSPLRADGAVVRMAGDDTH